MHGIRSWSWSWRRDGADGAGGDGAGTRRSGREMRVPGSTAEAVRREGRLTVCGCECSSCWDLRVGDTSGSGIVLLVRQKDVNTKYKVRNYEDYICFHERVVSRVYKA